MRTKILIVDDNDRNVFALSAVLAAKGYACISAVSAAEGLQLLLGRDDIAIVLADMMMPEIDGYEMLSLIKTGPRADVPVIAVTAQAMAGDKERCLAAGAAGYVAKPIDIATLLCVLDEHQIRSSLTAE